MMQLVFHSDDILVRRKLLDWAEKQFGVPFDTNLCMVASIMDPAKGPSDWQGLVIFNNYDGVSMELTIHTLGSNGRLTRRVLKDMAEYVFETNGCRRATVRCRAFSHAARMAERAGFVREGRIRQGYPDREDALIYGMLASECRWLKGSTHAPALLTHNG